MEKIKVLFVTGSGRSGTTLFDRVLGQSTKTFSAGELRHILERSFQENQLCGCKKPFQECDIWNEIVDEAFDEKTKDKQHFRSLLEIQKRLARLRYLPLMGLKKNKENFNKLRNEFLKPLYSSIYKINKNKYIIDSSKIPTYFYMLSQCNFIDLHVVHMIRDSRAVAFWWQKKKIRPEIKDKKTYMPNISPFRSSIDWVVFNLLILIIKHRIPSSKFVTIRYEDFVTSPKTCIKKIYDFAGIDDNLDFFENDNSVHLKPSHTVSGNPMRFKKGLISIQIDNQWVKEMSFSDKLLVTILTFPVLAKFYLWKN